ncbi:MAG: hypothetical protein COB09_18475 [Thalassobium sp.]|nr:MAG: hypothetical protein COB09_18475 [Thalassobium sp.]
MKNHEEEIKAMIKRNSKPLLCKSREDDREVAEENKDNGVGVYIPLMEEPRTRLDCMNLRTLRTPFMDFTYCVACDKWGTKKGWFKGWEYRGWKMPKRIYFVISGTLTFLCLAITLIPAAHYIGVQ